MNKYDIVYGTEQMIVINMVKHFWCGSYFNFFAFSAKFIVYQFLTFFICHCRFAMTMGFEIFLLKFEDFDNKISIHRFYHVEENL